MKWRHAPRETRLRLIAAAILVVGFGSAIGIYLAAVNGPANPFGLEPDESKQYLRQLEMYGGTANVLATELREWFSSLWHGKRLAVTVACLTTVLALGFFFVASRLPLEADAEGPVEHSGGGTDG